jgi:hypothetical protein
MIEIWTEHLSNTNAERQRYTNVTGIIIIIIIINIITCKL